MADDIPLRSAASLHIDNLHVNDTELRQYVLCEIEVILNSYNKSITDFGLPPLSENLLRELNNRLITEERNYDRQALRNEFEVLISKMNEKQKSEGKIVLAVASSGISSLLLLAGRTAHSRFKLPIDLTDETVCNIKKNTHLGNLLKETDLIVWDEAPMNDKKCFESLDRTLRDILDCESLPFGGKSIILGGDFRQTMLVKKKGSKPEIVSLSIVALNYGLTLKL
ncbi:ATP-dependent DNA helicase pfh1-like [Rutidosis leptorrhynchoides]|uniref:ATP-dependent DNA helicase pfh1-like n=1 Tax=Rutidosis leptorrhynchoides TaxID=125765 RepID=UPI003A996FB2